MKDKNEKLAVAAIRCLVLDAINKANSGHPGMSLDFAPIAYALYRDHLIADPKNPNWFNRDRIVFSSGHITPLIYSMLHISGFDVTMEDMMNFRQIGSKTPGHPEVGWTPGIDASAGPLGQGIGQAVGMAMAEKHLNAMYGKNVCDHHTYCICGDGCLEEGISQESISLAGQFGLNKLVLIYDANGSTLDGPTSQSMSEDVAKRFESANWDVIEVADGNNVEAVSKAIGEAKKNKEKPTVVIVHTIIGFGSKNQGLHKTHGAPLGEEDSQFAKKSYGFDIEPFTIPSEVYETLKATFIKRGEEAFLKYQENYEKFKNAKPEMAKLLEDAINRDLESYLPEELQIPEKDEATRKTSGRYLNALGNKMPFLFGGAADVAGSVMTYIKDKPAFTKEDPKGININYGIREFAMAAAQNGILLHGGLVPYIGCFFIFSDYMKPAIRMAAMEKIPAIFVFTHDSIAVGEDGMTHEPIEQIVALRSIPNLNVIRPADTKEVIGAYRSALLRKDGPTAIILSRQDLKQLEETSIEKTIRGGYIAHTPKKKAKFTIIATGSEVASAIQIANKMEEIRLYVEVVSMPSWELFEQNDEAYKKSVLHLPKEKRVSVELGSTIGWQKYAEHNIGIDEFGLSGKPGDVLKAMKKTKNDFAEIIYDLVKKRR